VTVDGFASSQVLRWGRYASEPSVEQLGRYFTLTAVDLARVARARQDSTRLGYAVQLTTVRFLSTFLTDPTATPPGVVHHVAGQLGIDAQVWDVYCRSRARLVHQQTIRDDFGFHVFGTGTAHVEFLRWLWTRAWTAEDTPSQLLDLASGWLAEHHILLPGFTVLHRLIARARDRAARRAWRVLAGQVTVSQGRRLDQLLVAASAEVGSEHVSELEVLRRQPRNPSIAGLVAALDRLDRIQHLGGDRINAHVVPAGRFKRLASEAATVKAQRVRRRGRAHRHATLVALAHRLHASAHDDTIDVLLLVLQETVGRIKRLGDNERIRTLGDLDDAALLLARAVRMLLDHTIPDVTVRPDVFTELGQADLLTAAETVERLITTPAQRFVEGLDRRYPTIQRFLPQLLQLVTFDATTPNDPVLAAVRHLRAVLDGIADIDDAPLAAVTAAWAPVVRPDTVHVDLRGYTLCTLDALRLALKRRDVFVPAADRWGDPRRLLLDQTVWRKTGPGVLRSLDLNGGARRLLDRLGDELDDAYHHAASVITARPDLITFDHDTGRDRLKVPALAALDLPAGTNELRAAVDAMMPVVELPDVLLYVADLCPYPDAFSDNITSGRSRRDDLALSVCAVLLIQACNVPYAAVARTDIAALTTARLRWVEENYIRPDTITAANNLLVDYQRQIPLVAAWGSGQLTSADGLRFTVPTRSIHTAPNPKYFGTARGVTLFNYVADTFLGWANIVITGTRRDSQFLLDRILDNPTSLDPRTIITDSASASDLIFGLCQLLGYRYSPRLADLPNRRLFRLDRTADYGPLNPLARQRINTELIVNQWDDICRVVGTLHTRAAVPSEVIQALQRGGQPTTLARAIAELGRIPRTIEILGYATDPNQQQRTRVQINRHEGRHALARDVFHGRRGRLYQPYRPGQEQQLAALGLVTNVVILFNTIHINHAVEHLRNRGRPIQPEHLEHLSPLHHERINIHGRYHFRQPTDPQPAITTSRDP